MDKIAVISDIHGNIQALESVLNDIKLRGIERIICLGDLVGKGPHSSEAIEIIRKECEVVVMGNWDDFITKPTEFEALKWHQKQLSEEQNDESRAILGAMFEARAEYLQAAIEGIQKQYGSVEAYAEKALGFTKDSLEEMKVLLLEEK